MHYVLIYSDHKICVTHRETDTFKKQSNRFRDVPNPSKTECWKFSKIQFSFMFLEEINNDFSKKFSDILEMLLIKPNNKWNNEWISIYTRANYSS